MSETPARTNKTIGFVAPLPLVRRLRLACERDGGGPVGPVIRRLLVRALELEEQQQAAFLDQLRGA